MSYETDPNAICVKAIGDALGVKVSTEMPLERPRGRYVQVAQTGGSMTPYLNQPIMTLYCWGTSDSDAYSLAVDSAHAMAETATEHPFLASSEVTQVSRDQWAPDGTARYMAQLKLTINIE